MASAVYANLNYVALPDTTADEIVRFREVFPFDKIALLANAAIVEAIPDLEMRTELALAGLGIEFDYVPVAFEAEPVQAAIPEGTQAVFMYPQIQLSPPERISTDRGDQRARTLELHLSGRGLCRGRDSWHPWRAADFFPRVARRIAINTQRILLGEDAGSIPVEISLKEELTINMKTARALGVSPTYEALLEARVLHPEAEGVVQAHTLTEVVKDAVRVNLDLLARERRVIAGEQDVERAGSVFFPQIDLGALGLVIDEDRAVCQLWLTGRAIGHRSARVSPSCSSRTTPWPTSRSRPACRKGGCRITKLCGSTLRSRPGSPISICCGPRASAGSAAKQRGSDPFEQGVGRGSTEDRGGQSGGSLPVAEPAGSRPQGPGGGRRQRPGRRDRGEQYSRPAPRTSASAPRRSIWKSRGELPATRGLPDSSRHRRASRPFQDFMVFEGVADAPELKILRSQIEVQERLLLNSKRAYWAPLIAAEATVDEILSKSGAGAEAPELPGGALFPTPDDTLWSVGLNATLPLFTGGARKADRLQAELELARFQLAFDSTAFRVEQRIRSAMELARASRTGIGLSQQAADAAGKNLDLVTEAYARGAVSIIDLLDAQNAALNAAEQAANAVYDFLIDLLEVERAANRIELLGTPETAAAFFNRLEKYFLDRGITP